MKRFSMILAAIGALVGCGGGSSGWIRLPTQITVNAYEGETIHVSVKGYATREPNGSLGVAVIVDGTYFEQNVPEPNVDYGDMSMTVTLQLLPTLTAQTYSTQIEARICEDESCETHVIPVTIHIAADPHNPTAPANGDFSSGTTGWTIDAWGGAAATLSAGTGALLVDMASPGVGPYGEPTDTAILHSPAVNLVEGTTYRLSFRARASSPRIIRASVSQGSDRDGDGGIPLYTYYGVNLTTDWVTYTSETFTMWETNRAARVEFYVGGSLADISLDDVTITAVP